MRRLRRQLRRLRRRLRGRAFVWVVACAPLAACSTTPDYGDYDDYASREEETTDPGLLERMVERDSLARVRPWERDLLSRDDMAWQPDPLQALRRQHIYFSKEGSLLGGTAGGGGCGCN